MSDTPNTEEAPPAPEEETFVSAGMKRVDAWLAAQNFRAVPSWADLRAVAEAIFSHIDAPKAEQPPVDVPPTPEGHTAVKPAATVAPDADPMAGLPAEPTGDEPPDPAPVPVG